MFELPMSALEALMTWRGSVKGSGTKSLLRCVQTLLVANYKKRLTSVIVNKGFATKYCHVLIIFFKYQISHPH